MKTRKAKITFVLPSEVKGTPVLRFYGDVFLGPSQPLEVHYEGQQIATNQLQLGVPVDIPLGTLPRNTPGNTYFLVAAGKNCQPIRFGIGRR